MGVRGHVCGGDAHGVFRSLTGPPSSCPQVSHRPALPHDPTQTISWARTGCGPGLCQALGQALTISSPPGRGSVASPEPTPHSPRLPVGGSDRVLLGTLGGDLQPFLACGCAVSSTSPPGPALRRQIPQGSQAGRALPVQGGKDHRALWAPPVAWAQLAVPSWSNAPESCTGRVAASGLAGHCLTGVATP